MQNGNQENQEAKVETTEETVVVEKVEEKKDETDYKSKYFYLAAELDNFRKRTEREKQNLIKFGNESILTDIIDVVDNFDRTIEMLRLDQDQKMKNVVTGLDMVKKQFIDMLTKNGLSVIECKEKDFDPNFHEAISQEYLEGAKPNSILREFQKGYILNGRVIRASKVVVASEKQ